MEAATTYPPKPCEPSTFGDEELNFCVRNGNRWDLFSIATAMVHTVGEILSPSGNACNKMVLYFPLHHDNRIGTYFDLNSKQSDFNFRGLSLTAKTKLVRYLVAHSFDFSFS